MFRFFSVSDVSSAKKQRLMKGALVLVGALFTLWLIVWLLPGSAPPPVSSDAAGTVANSSQAAGSEIQLLTPGRILVVLLLMGGIGYALYLRRQSNSSSASTAPMHSLGHLPITQDQQLKLVSCQNEVLLLGISPNEITLLRAYPREAFAEAAPPSPEEGFPDEPPIQQNTALSGFANVLRQYTNTGPNA